MLTPRVLLLVYRLKVTLGYHSFSLFLLLTWLLFGTFSCLAKKKQLFFLNLKKSYIQMEDDESATIMDATMHQYGLALEQIVRSAPTTQTVMILLKVG